MTAKERRSLEAPPLFFFVTREAEFLRLRENPCGAILTLWQDREGPGNLLSSSTRAGRCGCHRNYWIASSSRFHPANGQSSSDVCWKESCNSASARREGRDMAIKHLHATEKQAASGQQKEPEAKTATADSKPKTGRDLLNALEALGFIGMWADRTDIQDSSEFARQLREQAWTRARDA